jgi:hypothetical protein
MAFKRGRPTMFDGRNGSYSISGTRLGAQPAGIGRRDDRALLLFPGV